MKSGSQDPEHRLVPMQFGYSLSGLSPQLGSEVGVSAKLQQQLNRLRLVLPRRLNQGRGQKLGMLVVGIDLQAQVVAHEVEVAALSGIDEFFPISGGHIWGLSEAGIQNSSRGANVAPEALRAKSGCGLARLREGEA